MKNQKQALLDIPEKRKEYDREYRQRNKITRNEYGKSWHFEKAFGGFSLLVIFFVFLVLVIHYSYENKISSLENDMNNTIKHLQKQIEDLKERRNESSIGFDFYKVNYIYNEKNKPINYTLLPIFSSDCKLWYFNETFSGYSCGSDHVVRLDWGENYGQ